MKEGGTRSRTWDFSASLETSQAMNGAGETAERAQSWSLLGSGNGPGGAAGESREEAAGLWEWLALVSQDTPAAAGCPAPGWERADSTQSRLCPGRVWNGDCPGCSRSRGSRRNGTGWDGMWLMPGAKRGEKWGLKPSQGAEFGCSQSSPEPQGSISACHTAGAGRWRGHSWRPP